MSTQHRFLLAFLPLFGGVMLLGGCGAQHPAARDAASSISTASEMAEAGGSEIVLTSGSAAVRDALANRKIIYTADIELMVKDFQSFEKEVARIIEAAGGFASQRSSDRRHGNHRSGCWVIRVPVANYDRLVIGISALGFAKNRNETSQDVTADYVDLQARISNQRKLEDRVLSMLEERSGKLSDLLEMERELSRVREEIERMEGRLRVLTDQTDLATIRLSVTEEATYEPPAAPTVGDRIASAWTGSFESIGRVATQLAVVMIAMTPWAIVLSPVLITTWMIRRRVRLKLGQL